VGFSERPFAHAARTGYGRPMHKTQLKSVPFFGNLKKKDLELVAQQCDEIDVPAGKALARQGELGDEFFVIEEGTAEVTRDGQRIAELGPGDFFGEMALLEADRRNATVTAATPMTVIVMTRASFRAMHRSMPQLHAVVQQAIEQRRVPAR
jgi:CRP/FNR family transcriptional regulator, cyclic AMP receptor protein